ncbi:ATP-binding protein [Verrucomicrobiota bacterium sgz303538]
MHVIAAVFLGGTITILPVWFGLKRPGESLTRHLLAIAQMLMSALLIHLTEGRIETHFHVFGSLAFLAFYRDVRVLVTATVVTYLDHLGRGMFLPESVYGVITASPWRSLEHSCWVLFEVGFLSLALRRSLGEMWQVAERQISLENVNEEMEQAVRLRTKELAASEERFRLHFEHVPIGLFRAIPNGELLLTNPAFARMLGYESPAELLTAKLSLATLESSEEQSALLSELTEKGEISSMDVSWLRKDGTNAFVRVSAKAFLCNETGTDRYFEGSAEDITERRLLEERYLQSQKVQAIGQLAGGVAHDFNNILTAIIGYSDMVLRKVAADPEARRNVEEIKRAGERAAELTRQLLAFSRKQTLQPRVFQLNTVVTDMEKMLRRLVGEHVEIRTITTPNVGLVKADIGQVQQVLMNLVVNARDAMPKGGTLTLETGNVVLDSEYARLNSEVSPGEYVLLAVSDNGTGMSPEVKARIFEPFFTTKAAGSGTGLGLATCHGIVKQSGGHIAVYSELGHGTTFKVYLPKATESEEDAIACGEPPEPLGGNETVLLVEDEPVVRELGALVLSSLGYRVFEASNGREAITLVEQRRDNPFQLVVTDVVMPEMGGRELAQRLRELSPDTRILYSSGYTHDAIEKTDLLEEGINFLQKPYTMSVLAGKVREVLDHRNQDRPLSLPLS